MASGRARHRDSLHDAAPDHALPAARQAESAPAEPPKKSVADSARFAKTLGRRLASIAAFSRENVQQTVRLWCQDETRIGLHLPRYRRVSALGVKPRLSSQPLYKYYWLYGAVEPATGESFFCEMPRLDSGCFGAYLLALSKAYPESLNVVVVDGAPAHTAKKLAIPKNVVLLRLPPYCPELNPAERLWLDVKQRIDVRIQSVRESIDALREHVAGHLRAYTKEQMRSLTGYDYLIAAATALE